MKSISIREAYLLDKLKADLEIENAIYKAIKENSMYCSESRFYLAISRAKINKMQNIIEDIEETGTKQAPSHGFK